MHIKNTMRLLLILISMSQAKMEFATNNECQSCHTEIYKEFSRSMHGNSASFQDPIHEAVWDRHPKNKKVKKYVCGKCHTPAADNLSSMLLKGKAGTGVKALPDAANPTHREAISCSYCHRIDSVKHGKSANKNVISKKEKHYFGTMKNSLKSGFHTVSSTNKNFQNGNICMGCHSHKVNKAGLNVCSTNDKNELKGANCVSCHMPQVKGSVSTQRATQTHAFHAFPGAHNNQEMLAKYIDIEILKNINTFVIAVNNKSPHEMLLHPLRLSQLHVVIIRNGEKIKMKPHNFVRIIGNNGEETPPWIANTVVKNTMIHGYEKRLVKYKVKLVKGDKVMVHLGHFLVKPKALKKLGLDKTAVARKFYTLKKQTFIIK